MKLNNLCDSLGEVELYKFGIRLLTNTVYNGCVIRIKTNELYISYTTDCLKWTVHRFVLLCLKSKIVETYRPKRVTNPTFLFITCYDIKVIFYVTGLSTTFPDQEKSVTETFCFDEGEFSVSHLDQRDQDFIC